jgi:hypothetical protein
MDTHYKGLIWTNHAIHRMRERGISQGDAWATWNRPEQSRYAASKGAWVYYRTWPASTGKPGEYIKIEVVAKRNEKKQWVIISVWSNEVKNTNNQSPQKSLFLTLFRNIFSIKN